MTELLPKNLLNTLYVLLGVLILFVGVKTAGEFKSLKFIGGGVAPSTTMSFEGKGEVTAAPDIATINFTVRQEAKTAKEAQVVVTEKIAKTLDFIKKNDIAEKDIKTLNYNSYPKYDYVYDNAPVCADFNCPPRPGKQVIVGYEVSQNIEVKIRNIDDAGKIAGGLTDQGVTELSGPNFTIDEEDAIKEKARHDAIEDAKVKAEVLAKDLGVKLVRIVNFSESGNYPIYAYKAEAMSVSSMAPQTVPDLPTGENKITSNVTITYEIR